MKDIAIRDGFVGEKVYDRSTFGEQYYNTDYCHSKNRCTIVELIWKSNMDCNSKYLELNRVL